MSKNFFLIAQWLNSSIAQWNRDVNGVEPFIGLNRYILIITYYSLIESLSYCAIESFKKVEDIGVEPMTLCVQGRCSSQLS